MKPRARRKRLINEVKLQSYDVKIRRSERSRSFLDISFFSSLTLAFLSVCVHLHMCVYIYIYIYIHTSLTKIEERYIDAYRERVAGRYSRARTRILGFRSLESRAPNDNYRYIYI